MLAFYLVLFRGKSTQTGLSRLGALWFALIWCIILIPGKFFLHYYFQLLVPVSFCIAGFPDVQSRISSYIMRNLKPVLSVLLLAMITWSISLQYRRYASRTDHRREVGTYLNSRMNEQDVLYCNFSNIIYFLTHKSPVEKYVHPTLLTHPEHIQAVGLDVDVEMQKIVQAQPDYLVLEDSVHHLVQTYRDHFCRPVKPFGEHLMLYKRREE